MFVQMTLLETSIKQLELSQGLAIDGACTVLFKTREDFSSADQLLWRVSIALLALLGICQLLLAFDRSPSPDDALFLSVPKNWLNGYGWATSYSEKIPFNPDFTGPTALLLPAALLIQLFGNQLWIAGVTGAVINLVLLALCLQQIHSYWKNSGLAALSLVCGCIVSHPEDFASLIGYYSGSLLFFLAVLLAFNHRITTQNRSLLIGLLAALGLHIKWLMAPAFALLALLFLLHLYWQKMASGFSATKLLAFILLPIIILHGSWSLYRQHELSGYSSEFITAYKHYGDEFFHYHGSGIGQWQDAKDKVLYLEKNADKNLYFVEEALAQIDIRNPFLGNAPADEKHIVGWLLIACLISAIFFLVRRARQNANPASSWPMLVITLTVSVYLAWFVVFAMAMSPGHFYFQFQWLVWLAFLAISQSRIERSQFIQWGTAALLVFLSVVFLMNTEARQQVFLLDRTTVSRADAMQQAADYIRKTAFTAPLAGCGYSGYPRHIEYLLPTSQNFSDCLDLIEDHVEFNEGSYRWKSPLAFNLVFSLQSSGTNNASAMVLNQCTNKTLYRNNEVGIFSCSFADLQKLDLDMLMPEIQKTHRWYKTRITP